MRNFLLISKNLFFLISFVILLGSVWLYFDFQTVIGKHQDEIHDIELNRAYKTSQTISAQLRARTSNKLLHRINNQTFVSDISTLLSYYRNDEFKYIYIVYKDKKGAYRYLADGSEPNEKADLNQKFTPSLPSLWKQVFDEKNEVYDIQDNAEGLWLTYLSPILNNGAVEAILVLDISTQEYNNFLKLITPLNNFLNLFLAVLVVIVFVIALQGMLFYKQFKQSMIDALTKLYNRHYLDYIASRLNVEKTVFMIVDIDHFKLVNDTYGHNVGDIVLSSVAKKLVAATRLEDSVIRYGGEEFLILICSAKVKEDAIAIAQRIKMSIGKEKIRINENLNIDLSVSIGVNLTPAGSTLVEAISKADEMLYNAKNNGRNRIEIYNNN